MSASDLELQKMVRGFRVSDLQSLLIYAGRNKAGKKTELQTRALDLIKLHSAAIDMKIRELHRNRFQQAHGHTSESPEIFPPDMYSQGLTDAMGSGYSTISNHKSALGSGVPNYGLSINHQMLRSVPGLNAVPQYPVNPDVKFKDLPFYDVLNEILKPTSLVPSRGDGIIQEKELIFYLGPGDLRKLDSNTDIQVQFRIGCLESNTEQEDEFPSSVCIKVNKIVSNLPNPIPTNKPGMDPKRPRRPVDITSYVKRSTTEPQHLSVSWAATSNSKPYVTGIFLVQKQTSSVLIKRLKEIGVRNPDHTTAMIKEKLCHDRDSEIATMSLRGSLICPLGKIKMTLPCRARPCTHLQCFDAALYIQMNEKKPKWICPVCDKPAVFKNLAIDGLFLDITRKVPSECNEVQFHENGSWTPVMPIKKVPEISEATIQIQKVETLKPKKAVEVVDLDTDSDTEEESWPLQPPKKKPYKPSSLSLLLENPPPELTVKPYMYPPSSSKSATASSKSSTATAEKNSSSVSSNFPFLSTSSSKDFESSTSEYSPTSPIYSPRSTTPQPSTSNTFQETVDILNNTASNTAGQYDFDLYSLIQQKHEDTFQFQANSADDSVNAEETPDIISID